MTGARFFVDRGVGSRIVPDGLRAIGWHVVTMDERYGTDASQRISDADWIRDSSTHDEVILTKDRAIAKRALEAEAIVSNSARVLVIGSANITGAESLERLIRHRRRIERLITEPGPFVWAVGRDRLDPVRLRGA